jgi:hypothetical protein
LSVAGNGQQVAQQDNGGGEMTPRLTRTPFGQQVVDRARLHAQRRAFRRRRPDCTCDNPLFPQVVDAFCPQHGLPELVRMKEDEPSQ